MRIKIELSVDIDQAEWAHEFGLADSDRRDSSIRQDVRSYVRTVVQGQLSALGIGEVV